ncbi:MAG: ATP-binding protein, partial [Oscillospiraceae bacterium]|nr:ATP-binding protein [Oscillospiraceae bacterium]
MGSVHVLDDRVRELISAGEVVERPASVVKELVENALDAGADRIDIELRNHGLEMISVTDNGRGIEEDDIRTAFLRHATSKISSADDLNSIGSLGFRGEALAAIAAVSKVRLSTKTPENVHGFRYIIEGGREVSLQECGTPTGTNVTVTDLFYNTPARMKFLKKDVAEGNACEQLVWHIALSEPDVSFRLIREGKLVLRTTGQGLYSAIFDLFPRDVAAGMGEISSAPGEGVAVNGYVSSPTQSRASR